ncbi:MAG: acetylxylan esterase [Verrucomicrobiales bacterium]|nr:acetylxylan esterase [Verrucomicrobiales bacterium]
MGWAPGRVALFLGGILGLVGVHAAEPETNYDEGLVPAYTLPDPLKFSDGRIVRSAREWRRQRRAEVLELFRDQVYGHSPAPPAALRFVPVSEVRGALGGRAIRREVRVCFTGREDGPSMTVLLYLPQGSTRPVPAFLGLNFKGNQGVTFEPDLPVTDRWVRNEPKEGRVNHRATEASRGTESTRWPVADILARGYALATVYYGDIEPDHVEGWRAGVRGVFPVDPARAVDPNATGFPLADSDWGALGAWAWGLSRALDFLETESRVDAQRVAVLGHSRLGKAALWAGAQDERFAMVISNNSGEGGAALARRVFGETTARINALAPYWFCTNFKQYGHREAELPVDQHELLALMAPRPVYVASAEKDLWADPRGEFLAAQGAEPVYALFGKGGLGTAVWPRVNQPVGDFIGYHVRTGDHEVTLYDWNRYLDFADRHLKRRAR